MHTKPIHWPLINQYVTQPQKFPISLWFSAVWERYSLNRPTYESTSRSLWQPAGFKPWSTAGISADASRTLRRGATGLLEVSACTDIPQLLSSIKKGEVISRCALWRPKAPDFAKMTWLDQIEPLAGRRSEV